MWTHARLSPVSWALLAAVLLIGAVAWVARGGYESGGDTVFGSTVAQGQGETRREAFARINAAYGPVSLVRLYSPGPPPSWQELYRDLGAVDAVISFKAEPEEVVSGALDSRLAAWFAAAPTQRDTYWVYFHEPENDVEQGRFTASDFRAAWEHVAALAAGEDNERLHATVVLMCYTLDPASGRDWRDYLPGGDLLEVLAWDCYNAGSDKGVYADPAVLLDPAVAASDEADAHWGIAELGATLAPGDDGRRRAAWLTAVGEYARENAAQFVTYFDANVGGDFRLSDPASIEAWRRLVVG